eukprot:GHVU01189648.1.p1 GENE.GHVU01189648.1~~GHVU01189648.1.p1  ORF type:complete len:440 (-),score=40.95 GHVU01189648.1:153-1472(-)
MENGGRLKVGALLQEIIWSDDEEGDAIVPAILHVVDCNPAAQARVGGGSAPGRAPNIDRNRQAGHEQIMRDYFGVDGIAPTYPDSTFRRRFRMRRPLFLRILEGCVATDAYFRQKYDAARVLGLSAEQKVIAALRMLTHGLCADATDEYCRIGESTTLEALSRFCVAVIQRFGEEYLRQPTQQDVEHYMRVNENRGFPGMFGSLDCTHWTWKNCPVALQGQYQDRAGDRSVVMEAVTTGDLWIWHAYIGMPGSNNDLNVMDRSPLLADMMSGNMPSATYTVNGNEYSSAYLLVDGIYPPWSVFQKPISQPQNEKEKVFAKTQEAVRKDVERGFGVLQARFGILATPARTWSSKRLKRTWKTCVIVHNMVVEDERMFNLEDLSNEWCVRVPWVPRIALTVDTYLESMQHVMDAGVHARLRADLVEHQWRLKGEGRLNTSA